MEIFVSPSFLLVAVFFVALMAPAYIIINFFKLSTRGRKSPLSANLLRNPGQTLQEQIEDISIDIIGYLMIGPCGLFLIYTLDLTNKYYQPDQARLSHTYIYAALGIASLVYCGIKIWRLVHQRNVLRLGFECEVATGQDLVAMVRSGFNVYHDFPADGFNIDHIAIGPSGVFAIETKGRSKPLKSKKANHKVLYDGESLNFPTWSERKPLEQAKRQAKWLGKWIESSTGQGQEVVPVLSLPGWFIERRQPGGVKVYSGKGSAFLAKGDPVLSEERIKAISHQVEEKCRDVKIKSYSKK